MRRKIINRFPKSISSIRADRAKKQALRRTPAFSIIPNNQRSLSQNPHDSNAMAASGSGILASDQPMLLLSLTNHKQNQNGQNSGCQPDNRFGSVSDNRMIRLSGSREDNTAPVRYFRFAFFIQEPFTAFIADIIPEFDRNILS